MVNHRGHDVLCAGHVSRLFHLAIRGGRHLIEEHCAGERLGYLANGEYTALLRQSGGQVSSLAGDQGPRR